MVFLLSQSDSTMTIWDSTLFSSYVRKTLLASVSLYTLYYQDSDAFFFSLFLSLLSPFTIISYNMHAYIYIYIHDDEKWFLTFAVSTVAVRLRTHRLVLPVTAHIETFLGCLSVYMYIYIFVWVCTYICYSWCIMVLSSHYVLVLSLI